MEGSSIVGANFYDLTKAFDCVPPDRLTVKLSHYGFDTKSCKLLNSYLTDRKQYVCLNNETSDCGGVVGGVPQGSVLGPVLFLIYVNDMAGAVDGADLLLFADDTAIVGVSKNEDELVSLLGVAESSVTEWFHSNKLSINVNKTSRIMFTHRRVDFPNPPSVKYLGVELDPALSWEGHVDCLAKRIAKNIYLIRKLSVLIPADVLVTAYRSLVETHMRYVLLAWGHSSHASRIFSLQRRVVRILAARGYREEVRDAFGALKIFTLPSLYIYSCLLMAKQREGHILRRDIHNYPTRYNDLIDINFLRLNSSRYSSNYYSVVFMNKLPKSVALLPLNLFRIKIRSYLLRKSYYHFKEFLDDNITEGDILVSGDDTSI